MLLSLCSVIKFNRLLYFEIHNRFNRENLYLLFRVDIMIDSGVYNVEFDHPSPPAIFSHQDKID